MNTINAQTIINEVMQAHAVAPAFNKHDSFIKINVPPAPSSTDFGQSKPPAFRGNDNGDDELPPTPPKNKEGWEGSPVQNSKAPEGFKMTGPIRVDLAAQFPQLKRAENTYAGGKLAAVNARILLKAAFKGVKFSVKSDCNSMRLEWADGPTDAQVREVVGRFDIGEFDAYTDYHSTSSTAFSQLFGGVQHMTTGRTESDELVQMAIDQAFADAADKPTLNDWHKGTNDMRWGDWKRRWVSDALKTISLFSATKSHTKA